MKHPPFSNVTKIRATGDVEAASCRLDFPVESGKMPLLRSPNLVPFSTFSQKAAVLPFVLLLVALNVTVVVALLIYATTELQASKNSGQAEAARAMAQSGIDIAAGLIAANSTDNGFVTYQRVTNVGGAYRLETKIANTVAPTAAQPWKKVPTNATALHSGFASGTNGVDLNFSVGGDATAGFIAPRTNSSGWTNLSADMFRMEWIYIYKGPASDPKNLIGRVAYWVDDESTKLNINYSGLTNSYNTDYTKVVVGAKAYTFPANRDGGGAEFNGRIWPVDMDLGGIAGLSRTNAVDVIKARGAPWFSGFTPYPSVLGVRIGTIAKNGNTPQGVVAVTNLFQQSSMAFTATAYSREEERSYATGQKRYDMLTNLVSMNPSSTVTNNIKNLESRILADNPKFGDKYDIPSFSWAAFNIVQRPPILSGGPSPTDSSPPPMYVRGAPMVNEFSLKIKYWENAGNYTVEITPEVELIVLSQASQSVTYCWGGAALEDSVRNKISADIDFNSLTLNGFGNSSTSQWFQTYVDNTKYSGPNDTNFSTAIGYMSRTNTFTNNITPTNIVSNPNTFKITMKYDGKVYQSITIANTANITTPAAGQTNIYQLVAQPRGDLGYRGDPRFGVFESLARVATNTDNFAALGVNSSMGKLNTNSVDGVSPKKWRPDDFATDSNHPDLLNSEIAFGSNSTSDRGLANLTGSISVESGIGGRYAGIGWIGEVPVAAKTVVLGFSTPRLWGDGRARVNGVEYPPDWLLLDSLHMTPASTNFYTGAFDSFGRVNVNSAKTFFQTSSGNKTKADTIMDSVIINARTKDWIRGGSSSSAGLETVPSTDSTRTNLLSRIDAMTQARNSADNPYLTHFEFLADLAATNLPTSQAWWMAPDPATGGGDIYKATNTTDRRIEGIIRSLNQKLTTHGNQFSIFSLGQALQVVGSGATLKTNIVGEAYLQAVYERAPSYNETTGAITNSTTGAPSMRQLYLRELRY